MRYTTRMLFLLAVLAFAADSPDIKAAHKLQKKCDGGSGAACVELADLYAAGMEQLDENVGLMDLYQRACTLGNPDGCQRVEAANAPKTPTGGGGNEAACKGATPPSAEICLDVAGKIAGAARDDATRERARALFDATCGAFPEKGCGPLVEFLVHSGAEDGVERAMASACDAKLASYCVTLGRRLDASDQTEALSRFEQGCALGEEHACAEVGAVYYLGKGVKTDKAKARQVWQAACDRGVMEQCAALESLKAKPQDFEPRTKW